MRKRRKSSFQEKMCLWAFGPALGMICLSCISIVPISEEPSSPPSRIESATLPQEAPSAPSEPGPVRQKPMPQPSIKAEPEPEHKKAFYVHTVKWSGETVSIIAAWYTGDHQNWKALAQANPQIDRKLIHEGDKILIPERLLRTREPLPKEFVDRFYSESKKEKRWPKAGDNQTQEEEPKLFGPRKYPAK